MVQNPRGNNPFDVALEIFNGDRICGCGTKADAIDIAMKLTNEMIDNDCTLWALQVLTAFSILRLQVVQGINLAPINHPDNRELSLGMDASMMLTVMEDREFEFAKLLSKIALQSHRNGIKDKGLAAQMKEARAKRKEKKERENAKDEG